MKTSYLDIAKSYRTLRNTPNQLQNLPNPHHAASCFSDLSYDMYHISLSRLHHCDAILRWKTALSLSCTCLVCYTSRLCVAYCIVPSAFAVLYWMYLFIQSHLMSVLSFAMESGQVIFVFDWSCQCESCSSLINNRQEAWAWQYSYQESGAWRPQTECWKQSYTTLMIETSPRHSRCERRWTSQMKMAVD